MNEQAQPKIHVPPKLPQQELKRSQLNGKQRQMILLIVLAVVVIGAGAAYFFFFTGNTDTNEEIAVTEQANTAQSATSETAPALVVTNEKAIIFNLDGAVEDTFNANVGTTANQNVNVLATTNTTINLNRNTNTNTAANINLDLTLNLGDSKDTDNDKVPNNIEFWYGIRSNESDTDGDGYDDYTEIAGCYNPRGSGRIDFYHYIGYCVDSLIAQGIEHEEGSQFLLTEYCYVWSMEAEILIEEAVAGNDVNQMWIELNQVGFELRCEEMNDIDTGELTIDPDELCLAMQGMLAGFCNPTHW